MSEGIQKLSRRDFGKGAGILTASVILGPLVEKIFSNKKIRAEKQVGKEELIIQEVDGNRIYLNKNRIPVRCETRDGQKILFDLKETEKARQKAIDSKDSQVLKLISVIQEEKKYIESSVQPRTTELPSDVLSEEELGQKGVKIIQAEATQLHIRKGAFEKNEPLEEFNNSDRKLMVVLVDGPYLFQRFLSDQKYDEVREAAHGIDSGNISYYGDKYDQVTPEVMSEIRQKEIKRLKNDVSSIKKDQEGLTSYSIVRERMQKDLVYFESRIKALEDGVLTDEDLALYFSVGINRFYAQGWYKENYQGKTLIFMAVTQRKPRDLFSIYFDSDGKCQATSYKDTVMALHKGSKPRLEQTHPEPVKPLSGEVSHPGWVVRHELKHDKTRLEPNSSYDEEMMDQLVIEDLSVAYEIWRNSLSGKKSNGDEKYHFVFSLPEDEGGGYILTQKQPKVEKKAVT